MSFTEELSRLKTIIKNGHIPCRFMEKYSFISGKLVNCFEHSCFNLSNKQICQNFGEEMSDYFALANIEHRYVDDTEEILMNIVTDTGLQVKRSDSTENLADNQWRVALFFSKNYGSLERDRDFHFMLQEKDGSWSSKAGFTQDIMFLPIKVHKFHSAGLDYSLHSNFIITNPYACQKTL